MTTDHAIVTVQSLGDLAPGARVRVLGIDAAGSPQIARRLGALGFTAGSVVDVVRRAPLGDPVVYRVKDYDICLRRSEASRIHTTEVEFDLTADPAA